MKAFISYSTTDKPVAGSVKTVLDNIGKEAFLAHEDIRVSQDWKNRILRELKEAQIFVPLLSKAFKRSRWASQEIGLAFAQEDVLFIPLSIDGTIPFGFISHLQGKLIPDDGDYEELIISPIIGGYPHEVIPGLIKRMANAGSFRSTEAFMLPMVSHFDRFNVAEVSAFANASIDNGHIRSAKDCRNLYLPNFIRINRSKMTSKVRKALENKIA
ncbi:MAG: hypothetical protein BZY79_01970 [SAR202 cluster bacterium Casp-Chloro-G4]|nr:toll/interleukin-1 receptor domain-containing protein [Chloroflexota bacterium]MDA1228739.1 toll/interleukin-1 receptor domain-containing protein [Chloroflexota bacterium]PKB61792.1 MAG: hypothetical protein BZY79_01970 [SAR202 cluster bacterium Casp-Chloro-G4]